MEVAVLKRLQNCSPYICTLLGCGRTDRINYMIMTLLGPNLSELRKQQPKQKFSLSTTLRVGIQVIAAVRAIHDCGFLHRDVKPSNFAIGASPAGKQTCYVLDFGLARQYVTSEGEVRPPRPVAGFRGTVRYASVNAHQSRDMGRQDDMWSVFYLLIELANGELPWKKIRDKEKAGKFKMGYDHKRLIKNLPAELFDFLDHLNSLDYYREPDYVMLSTLLQNAVRYLGIKRGEPFDWERDSSVQSLTTISVGSAPALQTNQNARREKEGREGDSRTHVSTEDSMSQNGAKKDAEIARKFSSNDENGRIKSAKTGTAVVLSDHRHKQLSLVQHRRSMPPSPLLQATHLLLNHQDSGLPHTSHSLDRFFDMQPGEKSQSSKASNRSRKSLKTRDPAKQEKCSGNSEGKRVSRGSKKEGQEKSKSESQTSSSSESVSRNECAPVVEDGNEKSQRDKDTREAPIAQSTHKTCNFELLKREPLKREEVVTSSEVHPDLTPSPLVGYSCHGDNMEQSSPSESSCLQHRLFAREIQPRADHTNPVEQVAMETIPITRGRGRHSPGPPPLEFHEPLKMWGRDASQPISLVPTRPEGEENVSSVTCVPRPPDEPPPRHYTLLAARRRRYRRPGKT